MSARLEPIELRIWPGAPVAPAWRLRVDVLAVTACAFGAHLLDVRLLDGEESIPISLDSPQVPLPRGFHGATAGRWANRIAGARFILDGVEHRLAPNEGPNQLHGGPSGFNLQMWELVEVVDAPDVAGVRLRHVSPHGDQGFPGELDAAARFVVKGNRLEITYEATTSAPTVVNLTNHVYWNLGASGTLDGHRITIAADRYVAVDEANIPLPGPVASVEGTRFDCRGGSDLAAIVDDGGFDHCFVVRGDRGPSVRLEHESGRTVTVETDQPGCQVYTGQHLDPAQRGVAIEAQRIPDGPNRPDLGPSVLRPGEQYRNHTVVTLDG